MSFKKFDQQTFIIDTANAYTSRQISKREFLRKMGMAGIGLPLSIDDRSGHRTCCPAVPPRTAGSVSP